MFATLHQGETVIGLAAGVWRRCRLSQRPRHFRSPTLPVLTDPSLQPAAIVAWTEYLRQAGAAEVIADSYDSRWGTDALPTEVGLRQEYVVSLGLGAEQIAARFSETHRRHLRRGDREGWVLRMPDGPEALNVLRDVCTAAADRAHLPSNGFDRPLPFASEGRTGLQSFWGVQTFATWHDDSLLAAVLIGWANHRAYYILGGSTPEGYRRSAAVWLHWRIMGMLAEHGCKVYNLGGTAASAVHPDDPAHGLYRFKSGFGAETRLCRGARWQLRLGHLRAHQAARWLSAVLSGSPRS